MTIEQARWAYRIGLERDRVMQARGAKLTYGYRPTPEQRRHTTAMAAVAEFAVALATGRPWLSLDAEGPDDPMSNDVMGGISVRWTPLQRGSLIVYPTELDHLKCVLVVGDTYPLRIVGWAPITECKQRQFWKADARYPTYFVPQHVLARRNISDLKWQKPNAIAG